MSKLARGDKLRGSSHSLSHLRGLWGWGEDHRSSGKTCWSWLSRLEKVSPFPVHSSIKREVEWGKVPSYLQPPQAGKIRKCLVTLDTSLAPVSQQEWPHPKVTGKWLVSGILMTPAVVHTAPQTLSHAACLARDVGTGSLSVWYKEGIETFLSFLLKRFFFSL